MLLHGIFPPITTPFNLDGNVYFRKLEHNVARYSKTPITGIVVLGSTGECVLLSDQERRDVLRCAREAAAPSKVLVAGTGCESAMETLRLTEHAAELGYDIAMVRTPSYYRAQTKAEHILAFYRFVADRSALPVIIYNMPPATGYDMPAEVVIELAGHFNIIGIKESSGSNDKVKRMEEGTRQVKRTVKVTEAFQPLTPRMLRAAEKSGDTVSAGALAASSSAVTFESGIRTREKEVGFQVLVGSAQTFHQALQSGAVGGILAFADPAPTAMYEVYAAWKDGDEKLAAEKQQRVAAAAVRVAGQMGVAGVKYACDLNGYYGGPVRLPLLPLTADLKTEVEAVMSDIRC